LQVACYVILVIYTPYWLSPESHRNWIWPVRKKNTSLPLSVSRHFLICGFILVQGTGNEYSNVHFSEIACCSFSIFSHSLLKKCLCSPKDDSALSQRAICTIKPALKPTRAGREHRSSDVTNASRSLRMKTAVTNQVKTAIKTCRWLKTTRNRCFTGFRDDLCCQNSTLENKKAIRDDKLTRVLGEGKCLY